MFSNTPLADIAAANPPRLLHLYLLSDPAPAARLLVEATRHGFTALVLTIDTPIFGRRERDRRNVFTLPENLSFPLLNLPTAPADTPLFDAISALLESNFSIDTLAAFIKAAPLPVYLKGILRPDDAHLAVSAGAAGIIISNHGARQLEGAIPSLYALPAVVAAVPNGFPVLLDSGVRSGEDVVRALALGACAVLVGRPVIWALAEAGEEGVGRLLGRLVDDLKGTMRLVGAGCVEDVERGMVVWERECKL